MSRLSQKQREVLAKHVRGRVVHDLGAGDCRLSAELLDLGAAEVVSVDKECMPLADRTGLRRVQMLFVDYMHSIDLDALDVVFVSWPVNYFVPGLTALMAEAKTTIYVGKNTDIEQCGWPALFQGLACREVLDAVPERRNTMIVYGDLTIETRPLVGDEFAAISAHNGVVLTFEQAERRAARRR